MTAQNQNEQAAVENLPKSFKSRCIDLTPKKPVNIGYVGGVRVPKTKAREI